MILKRTFEQIAQEKRLLINIEKDTLKIKAKKLIH